MESSSVSNFEQSGGDGSSPRRAALAPHGRTLAEVELELADMLEQDRQALAGVKFGRRFFGGEDLAALASRAYGLFAQTARSSAYPGFPGGVSMPRMQREVIENTLNLLNAPAGADGVITSGGTESVILAVKACVTRARSRGMRVSDMEILAANSAHPCLDKAADLLGVNLRRIQTTGSATVDVDAIAAAASPRTVMLYGSFPSYAYGSVDDIGALGRLALRLDTWLHVDACMSGFLAPFARMNGEPIPDFDFLVPGVSSLSADLHKHGYSAKGASALLFRSAELAAYGPFSYTDHPLPPMRTPTLAGTAPGAAIASAWAVMTHLGIAGYRDLTRLVFSARRAFVAAVESVPGFAVLGSPLFSIVVITSPVHDLAAVHRCLTQRSWFTLPVSEPRGIHLNIGAQDEPLAAELARDLSIALGN